MSSSTVNPHQLVKTALGYIIVLLYSLHNMYIREKSDAYNDHVKIS